jgi:predicted esterase
MQSLLFVLALLSIIAINSSCNSKELPMITGRNGYQKGHLNARPKNSFVATDVNTGIQALGLGGRRDAILYVPKCYNKEKPARLAVMLHGAGGQAEHGFQLIKQYADEQNIILLAPASQQATWDVIVKNFFDDDVVLIDQALSLVFDSFYIDPSHIAIGGFSDGASYALSLGLSNGDLFTHLIAFSPGFYYTVVKAGNPRVFISHGTNDGVLPINSCSRRIVSQLQGLAYDVEYMEFKGEHEIPGNISAAAVNWFVK